MHLCAQGHGFHVPWTLEYPFHIHTSPAGSISSCLPPPLPGRRVAVTQALLDPLATPSGPQPHGAQDFEIMHLGHIAIIF
jgi:hypothetical protein